MEPREILGVRAERKRRAMTGLSAQYRVELKIESHPDFNMESRSFDLRKAQTGNIPASTPFEAVNIPIHE